MFLGNQAIQLRKIYPNCIFVFQEDSASCGSSLERPYRQKHVDSGAGLLGPPSMTNLSLGSDLSSHSGETHNKTPTSTGQKTRLDDPLKGANCKTFVYCHINCISCNFVRAKHNLIYKTVKDLKGAGNVQCCLFSKYIYIILYVKYWQIVENVYLFVVCLSVFNKFLYPTSL